MSSSLECPNKKGKKYGFPTLVVNTRPKMKGEKSNSFLLEVLANQSFHFPQFLVKRTVEHIYSTTTMHRPQRTQRSLLSPGKHLEKKFSACRTGLYSQLASFLKHDEMESNWDSTISLLQNYDKSTLQT